MRHAFGSDAFRTSAVRDCLDPIRRGESKLAGFAQPCRHLRRKRNERGRSRICGLPAHLEQHKGKVIVIDNYDSFTYNLSQVSPSNHGGLEEGTRMSHTPLVAVSGDEERCKNGLVYSADELHQD